MSRSPSSLAWYLCKRWPAAARSPLLSLVLCRSGRRKLPSSDRCPPGVRIAHTARPVAGDVVVVRHDFPQPRDGQARQLASLELLASSEAGRDSARSRWPRRPRSTKLKEIVDVVNDPTSRSRSGADPHPVRLHAGRPGLDLETLEPFGLGGVGYFLDLANDDHAPPGLINGIGAVNLKRRGPRAQTLAKLGAQRRAEHDGLRLIIERVVDRTDHWWRHTEGNPPNAPAGSGEHSHAPVPADLEEIDPSVVRCRQSLAHIQIVSQPALGFSFPPANYKTPGVRACRIARRVGVADRYARGRGGA